MKTMRIYNAFEVAAFLRTSGPHGWFSNFARCSILVVWPRILRRMTYSSESLYQALKFTHDLSPRGLHYIERILSSPAKEAKELGRARPPREDWEKVKIRAMEYCLRAKADAHPATCARAFMHTHNLPIVEVSFKDGFWGALPHEPTKTLRGKNALGRLWMKLRQEYVETGEVQSDIEDLFLLKGYQGEIQKKNSRYHRSDQSN